MNADVKSSGDRDLTGYRLTVGVGDPLSPDGLTRLTLDGNGEIQVQQVYADEGGAKHGAGDDRTGPPECERSGRIDGSEAASLLRSLTQLKWDRKFPPRPGIPDEAIVEWSLRKSGDDVLAMKTWLEDAERDPGLGPVLSRLRNELARLSDDQLYF